MFKIIKVTGNSLSPCFLPGDYVITGKESWLIKDYTPGDIIVFDHSDKGLLIKKILSSDSTDNTYEVSGTHPQSADSSTLGKIHYQDILGKVIWHIKKPRSRP